jgi:hypothetical protein
MHWDLRIDGGIVFNWSQQHIAKDANDEITWATVRQQDVRVGWKQQILTKSCPQTPVGKMYHFNDCLPGQKSLFQL